MTRPTVTVAELVFVGFNSRVVALHRENGHIVWQWKSAKGRGAVSVMLDGDRLIAAVNGYVYCLDAATGDQLWQNEMKGLGLGITCLSSFRSSSMASSMLGQRQADASNRGAAAAASAT